MADFSLNAALHYVIDAYSEAWQTAKCELADHSARLVRLRCGGLRDQHRLGDL